jgi:outer membrane protein OmpA-like peptidoglycan-associated protein
MAIIPNNPSENETAETSSGAALAENARAELPSIDIDIPFAFDSDRPLPEASDRIRTVGLAMADDRLDGATFVLLGHTDATGGAAYNKALSERRARALKERLVLISGVASERFIVRGVGESRLKNARDPDAPENRRVQIVVVDAE